MNLTGSVVRDLKEVADVVDASDPMEAAKEAADRAISLAGANRHALAARLALWLAQRGLLEGVSFQAKESPEVASATLAFLAEEPMPARQPELPQERSRAPHEELPEKVAGTARGPAGTAGDRTLDGVTDRMLGLLRETPLSGKAMVRRLGVRRAVAYRALANLKRAGLVVQDAHGAQTCYRAVVMPEAR